MIKKTANWVASAGFVFATFAGAQIASAEVCQSSGIPSTDSVSWSCGRISATLSTSLTDATLVSRNNWFTGTPHLIQIELDCADETNASAESFSINDQDAAVACPNDNIVQVATGWVITNPDGFGQGEGEGSEESGE